MGLEQRRKEGGEGKPAAGPGGAAPRPQPAHKPKDKDDKPKEEVKVCDTGLSNAFRDIGSLHTSFSLKNQLLGVITVYVLSFLLYIFDFVSLISLTLPDRYS